MTAAALSLAVLALSDALRAYEEDEHAAYVLAMTAHEVNWSRRTMAAAIRAHLEDNPALAERMLRSVA